MARPSLGIRPIVFKVVWKVQTFMFRRTWRLSREPDRFLRNSRGVIHVGANSGQERDHYEKAKLEVVWIEPVPAVFAALVSNIRNHPRQKALNALATDTDGTTDVDAVVVRDGKNLKGKVLGFVLGHGGQRVLGKAFRNTAKAIEERKDALVAMQPLGWGGLGELAPRIDPRVLGFTFVIAAGTCIAAGLVPALRATRLDLTAEFQGGARTVGSRATVRLRRALMVVRISVSCPSIFMRSVNSPFMLSWL